MDPQRLIPGDATLIENIVNYLKAKGIFDDLRHDCLADVDTKSSCQNLSQRVDGYTSKFLANETWHPDLNKNELRNKLRRHIDESGMLAVGADHVVEQVINPKIHQLLLPKIIEVVHQYMKEQNDLLNKKPDSSSNDNMASSEKGVSDTSDNKSRTSVSDPIADILSFSYSKSKTMPATSTSIKTDIVQQKHADLPKLEKKKEEKSIPVAEKNISEILSENLATSVVTETKPQIDKEKEKLKKDDHEILQEVSKKAVKEELKPEKKKTDDAKVQSSEAVTSVEEYKINVPTAIKPSVATKKDIDKNKQKLKSLNTQKSSNSSSEMKKLKKESSDKPLEKHVKSKPSKSSKESLSPTKNVSSMKIVFKDEKLGEYSKSKSSDSSSSKTSESSGKKSSKCSSIKKDSIVKHKGYSEKTDKSKISKSADKSDQNIHNDSSNSEKITRNIHYSSSYDSSQGSDQEKSSFSSSKKERPKHFSKYAKKEKSEDHPDKSSKTSSDKKKSKDVDESISKKHKIEKSSKHEKFKDTIVVEAAKISSRSNSFGSTSSVGSSSNASKDNLVSNSDDISESSIKEKKKKQLKEKDSCHNLTKTLPPPPPPPPPSSSLSCELTSSAEMSSMEDTQSSSDSETSSSEEISEGLSSESELESNGSVLNTLNESVLNSSTDNINAFYDIFLYSSSSSEFEGYAYSPEKKKEDKILQDICDSDISVSSVHTSDLSSYDDELSDNDCSFTNESHSDVKKKLTLKEAQELIQNKALLLNRMKNSSTQNKSENAEISANKRCTERNSAFLSSDEESSPSEPKRSLRRERKLNPRYASSEYTSIFNSRKETFITKQSSPSMKSHSVNCTLNVEPKYRKKDSLLVKSKLQKKNSLETKIVSVPQDEIENSQETKSILYNSESSDEEKVLSDISDMASSDEITSFMDKEKLFQENKPTDNSDTDHLKIHLKLKLQNSSKLNMNSYSLKRKLTVTESTPVKRPCSRSSVDSTSSELIPNENKPFNSEKQSLADEKMLKECSLKGSELTDGIKKDLFCKQRTSNNGDILGQKDIFPKNSHGKTINTSEKKTSESGTSKELNVL